MGHYGGELVERWGEFARQLDSVVGWEWYGTFTFRNDRLAPEACERCWSVWLHALNRRVYGVRYFKRRQGVAWLRGTESHQARQVRHYHALLGARGQLAGESVFEFMDRWNELAGFARIYPYDADRGAAWYVTKYVAKDGEVDVWTPHGLTAVHVQRELPRVAATQLEPN